MKVHAPNVQFIVAFDILYFIGLFSLLFIIATALLAPSIQRSSTWYMFIWSWIITCITSLILVGQQTGPAPSTGVCLFQATLIYATPVLSSIYALAFMLQAFLNIRGAIRDGFGSSRAHMILIHALPLGTSAIVLIEAFVLGLTQPGTIKRIDSGMYCHLSNPLPGQISSGITIAAMISFMIIGFWTIIMLQRRRVSMSGKDGSGTLSPDVVTRVLVFSFFPIIGLALSSLHYLAKNGTTANIILAARPVRRLKLAADGADSYSDHHLRVDDTTEGFDAAHFTYNKPINKCNAALTVQSRREGPPNRLPDALGDQRRKWDILRITFEATVYTSRPPSTDSLSEELRNMLGESSQALSKAMYTRSLALFTPTMNATASNAAYLPPQVLATLVYSSLKLNAPDAGRVMIEDWLAVREPQYASAHGEEGEGDGYAKVLELYCVHILPKLGLWDYAEEFLGYESELSTDRREHLKTTLNTLHVQAISTRQPFKPEVSSSVSPRSYSPAPSSASSSSSSISTTSTHTVVPGNRSVATLTKMPTRSSSSSSASSSFSDETATPRATQSSLPAARRSPALRPQTNGKSIARQSPRSASASASSSASSSFLPSRDHLGHLQHEPAPVRARPTANLLALVRSTLAPHLTRPKLTTFLLLFVLVPLVSFVLRIRRRRRLQQLAIGIGAGAAAAPAASAAMVQAATNAERVRRRLQVAGAESGLVQRAWGEVVRVVGDTVRMAGSGLV
ncbi:hypothetical protein D9619_005005 [Psilocybe cf. subviscida]|uniref:Uncharacterized protein n=1 Tax=Psilocybe cf. subviscida TaxID=2480587 RepID=A0A8H5BPM1_9AGAR|nr:hypothetical protein D9619_005005 [Psilocybe cf. subviscida]